MKKGLSLLICTLLTVLPSHAASNPLEHFTKPMTRLDFATYQMGEQANKRMRDAIIENDLRAYASQGKVTYAEDPLEIRVHGQIWGLSEDNTSEETCRSLLFSYAKKMSPDERFWAKLGPSIHNEASTPKPGEQIAQHINYEIFLDQLPVNYEKRIKCSLKDSEI